MGWIGHIQSTCRFKGFVNSLGRRRPKLIRLQTARRMLPSREHKNPPIPQPPTFNHLTDEMKGLHEFCALVLVIRAGIAVAPAWPLMIAHAETFPEVPRPALSTE